jgi:hypothetical protein
MKILLICGSLNQTTMMHKIAQELSDHECYFSPYYADGFINLLAKGGMLNNTILGGLHHRNTMKYLRENDLPLDVRGKKNQYDLVLTGSDAIIQKNIRNTRIMLIQEGMTEPEGILYHLVKALKLPRWLANTSVTGLSNAFDAFCVASQGYRDLFIHKGIHPEKIVITGIPNFDNLGEIRKSDFPYENFVLVATTPFRETMRPEIRPLFIRRCVEIADGRQLIFKLHPLENAHRAIREINRYAPGAKVYWRGDINKMMAKAQTVITQWSSCTFVALALGKEVYSDLKASELRQLMPIQNGGTSAHKIAQVCRQIMNTPMPLIEQRRRDLQSGSIWDHLGI